MVYNLSNLKGGGKIARHADASLCVLSSKLTGGVSKANGGQGRQG